MVDKHYSVDFNWTENRNRATGSIFWDGKNHFNITIQNILVVKMDSFYANQATSWPHFSGHYWQAGSGFGALAAGIGRVALPLARRFVLPTAKRIEKELRKQSVPEILDVVSNKKSPKQAVKNTISKTVKKQTGGSCKRFSSRQKIRNRPRKTKTSIAVTKRKGIILSRRPPKRNRADFFAKVKNDR